MKVFPFFYIVIVPSVEDLIISTDGFIEQPIGLLQVVSPPSSSFLLPRENNSTLIKILILNELIYTPVILTPKLIRRRIQMLSLFEANKGFYLKNAGPIKMKNAKMQLIWHFDVYWFHMIKSIILVVNVNKH